MVWFLFFRHWFCLYTGEPSVFVLQKRRLQWTHWVNRRVSGGNWSILIGNCGFRTRPTTEIEVCCKLPSRAIQKENWCLTLLKFKYSSVRSFHRIWEKVGRLTVAVCSLNTNQQGIRTTAVQPRSCFVVSIDQSPILCANQRKTSNWNSHKFAKAEHSQEATEL